MRGNPMVGLVVIALAGGCAPKRPAEAPAPASGESAIRGVVSDVTTFQPLRGVGVELALVGHQNEPIMTAATDEKGTFVFASVPANNYMLRVVRPGYQEVRLTLDATKPQERPLDVRLRVLGGALRCTPSRYHTLECP